MRIEQPTRGLLASKAGFVLFVVTGILIVLVISTIFCSCSVQLECVIVMLDDGSVYFHFFEDRSSRGYRLSFWSNEYWNWDRALRPIMDRVRGAYSVLFVPMWTLIVSSAFASWFYYRRAKRKRLIGHCPNCEYDLTGNTSGVCPECGARIETAT